MHTKKENILLPKVGFFCAALIFCLLIAGIPSVHAIDPPHDETRLPAGCEECHLGGPPGPQGLTQQSQNVNLCLSCHTTATTRGFGLWKSDDQAVPGTKGTLHRWETSVVDPEHGSDTPTGPLKLDGDEMMCSTCHNQHTAGRSGSVYVSPVEVKPANSGTGRVSVNPTDDEATARNYLLEIIDPSTPATFRISNDGGISWFGWDGASWSPGMPVGRPVGPDVLLNDGTSVSVSFEDGPGAYATGDRFEFAIFRPMLRVDNTASAMCLDCHLSWNQSSSYVQGGGDGIKRFSHPVGESLSRPYDRLEPLDADGAFQSPGDGNETNDLILGSGGEVHCMTCHQPHGADSNSLTEDSR